MADPTPQSPTEAAPAPIAPAELLAGRTILQVVPALDAGGVERTAVDVAAAVARAGGRSLVASAGGRLEGELEAAGVESLRLPLDRRSPVALVANALKLKALIAAEGIDLVHARSRAPAWSALWAARQAGAPFITTYAGIYSARSGLKRAYNAVMARGDVVIANSTFTRDHLLREHGTDPERAVAIPRGLDLAHFDAAAVPQDRIAAARAAFGDAAAPGRTVALLAGRLTRWKGQTLAIEALAKAVAEGGDLSLVLAGDAQGRKDYEAELKALAERLGVADRFVQLGHWADMPAAYLAADIAIAPSLEPEAFGRTAAEPQAMGRPVLAADHGGARETVQHGVTGVLVAPGDVEAWAKAFVEAAAWHVHQRRDMGRLGRERVRSLYSVAAMTDATLAIYARLLAQRPRR